MKVADNDAPVKNESNDKVRDLKRFVQAHYDQSLMTKSKYTEVNHAIINYMERYDNLDLMEIYKTISVEISKDDCSSTPWSENSIEWIIVDAILMSTESIAIIDEIVTRTPPSRVGFDSLIEYLDRRGISRTHQYSLISKCKTQMAKNVLKMQFNRHNQQLEDDISIRMANKEAKKLESEMGSWKDTSAEDPFAPDK